MKQTRLILCVIPVLLTAVFVEGAVPVVTNVVASQQVSNKLVDIYYDVFDDDGDTLKVRVEVSDNGGNLYSVPAFTFTGDIGEGVVTGANKHIVWDAGTDWDGEYSDEMRVKVIAVDAQGLPGLEWGNEIPPGGFLMGQDGGAEGSGPSRHVNIPWSYWLSKYEIRNDQYCEYLNTALVAGEVYRDGTVTVKAYEGSYEGVGSGYELINIGDERDIRWNVNNFEVCGGRTNFPVRVTWYGAIAFAQHYGYDLPTTAEWEKAARGPDHDDEDEHMVYPWGDSLSGGNANYYLSGDPWDGDTKPSPVGYYDGNQTPFGPDMQSDYGLYDLIGNVCEWTRTTAIAVESYQQEESLSATNNQIADGSYGSTRIARGGSFRTSTYVTGLDRTSSSSGWHLKSYVYLYCNENRDYGGSYSSSPDMGFRVIRRDVP